MTISIVFHPIASAADESPFIVALRKVAEGGSLDLVCPYLSLEVLKEHIATTNWRLLTDLHAWMDSYDAQAVKIADFVERHPLRIRDCRDLHAKVAIGRERALAGSANFTRSGLEANHELSVVLEDRSALDELRAWFDALWLASSTPNLGAVRARAEALNAPHVKRLRGELADALRGTSLGTAGPRVRRVQRRANAPLVAQADLAAIAVQIRGLFDDSDSANAALDLLNEAVALSGLGADDTQLFVNATPSSEFTFSIQIGNKYVATVGRLKGHLMAALMVSEETMRRPDVRSHVLALHKPFRSNKSLYLARLPWSHPFTPPAGVLDDWRRTLRAEAQRAGRSPYRARCGFRSGPFYAVTDSATRDEVLRLAYGPQTTSG
ncbi:MAG: hypothetical protein K8H88_31450 [Sandaracinaceae bacterium]|nr:hypothetical protein [Sandaracinaceae bacterium]